MTFLLLNLLISSCTTAGALRIEAPVLACQTIAVDQGTNLNLLDYCSVAPETAIVDIKDEVDTEEIGIHTVNVIISDGIHNNFTMETITYEILKVIPECPENAAYDEELDACLCNEGYIDMGKDGEMACELKAVCDAGYYYRESDNTCVKRQSQTPSTPSTPPADNSGSSGNDNSGGNSGGSSGGGGGGKDTPTPPPSGAFINATSITVKVGTSIPEVQAKLVAGISSSSGYWVDYSAVNTSVPGSYPVYIHGNDGAEGSCTVTVVE